ncbi:SYNA protein, partial [Anseranas semipalmata]|nr:SYNA protein [Anseranas semipalmata]
TKFHSFVCVLFPGLGVVELETATVDISAKLEVIQNALKDLESEINSLSQLTIQNHGALDYFLASQGGICLVLNTICCFYANKS